MAKPTNTPVSGNIWHLNIDDLFAPLPQNTRLGGPGPFVINLSVSTAPIDPPPKSFLVGGEAQIYQVQRSEDHRLRYRLRLGPFADENAAHVTLEKVRDIYPGALTATADADDLRAIAALRAKAAPAVKVLPAVKVVEPEPPVLSLVVEPAAVGAPARAVQEPKSRSLSVESTRTVRALTLLELESEQASRWFVIQLALSEEAFESETVPNLDIFGVYRLYSVAGIDQGRIVHALRLGFFAEEIAAAAVASYLSGFYDDPTVKRVSSAERERFAEQRFEPRKDVGATGKHAVIEITDERYVREKRNTSLRTNSQNNK